MIFVLGFEVGARLSFFSVAVWWAVFTIPILRQVPEPPSATAELKAGETVISTSMKRLWATLKDLSRYRELLKYLIAFLIYNDAIGTIIGVAAIYGAELGFSSIELILALLLVQFAGIPFALIFGRLPSADNQRRPLFLAFIIFNLVALPLGGILGSKVLPQNLTGVLLPPYETTDGFSGTGVYQAGSDAIQLPGTWENEVIPAATLGTDTDVAYSHTSGEDAQLDFPFNGQEVTLTYATGPDHGIWGVLLDGRPLTEPDDVEQPLPLVLDAYSPTLRYGVIASFSAPESGQHTLSLVNNGGKAEASTGTAFAIGQIEVLRPVSQSSLPVIIGGVIALQLIGLLFAYTIGRQLFAGWAARLDTRGSILLALLVYSVIATWGFLLNSALEFWYLAWMVAIVQGGSQALSRSLFAYMSPAAKSGEFFGLFGIMEKFSSFVGPLIFAVVAANLGSSRPAILALIAFFVIGGFLLTRVNIAEGHRVAVEEDAAAMQSSA
jgi:MFS-type transporter involved in bile tolerance (Atg22 family)